MFQLLKDDNVTKARRGVFTTPHGKIETPAFFPVATQGAVKGLTSASLEGIGINGLLMNTYHLFLRPGRQIVKDAGGLHAFSGFNGTIITDSGGYQIFSLEGFRKVTDEGVTFQSYFDGTKIFLTPEEVMAIQADLGADVVVPLDECVKHGVSEAQAGEAAKRTTLWLKRSCAWRESYGGVRQIFFGIVQGAVYPDLRKYCLEEVQKAPIDGLCIGGLSVGEPADLRYNMLSLIAQNADPKHIRYFMGYGRPGDIVEAVSCGADLFDCIVPTRYARTGTAYTTDGKLVIRNAPYLSDYAPLDKDCACYVCRRHSRAYLRHLINVNEMAGTELVTYHNVFWYNELMKKIRAALDAGRFSEFKKEFFARFKEDVGNENVATGKK